MLNIEFLQKIKMVAPGTLLRSALDDMVMANLGALICFLDDIKPKGNILQGGFYIGANFSPQKLYELAKMDGAIILDEGVSRILAANVHLTPDNTISTTETGMRHRTAERVAKQTGKFVIAISKRKGVITVFHKTAKHHLSNLSFLITRIDQTMNTLARYKDGLDKLIFQLDVDEFTDRVRLSGVVELMCKALEIEIILREIEPFIIEAGSAGRLSGMQFETLSTEIHDLLIALIMDYATVDQDDDGIEKRFKKTILLDHSQYNAVATVLGWDMSKGIELPDTHVRPRGYRLLRYAARLPINATRNAVRQFKNMLSIAGADINALMEIEGIGEKRAWAITGSINAIKNKIAFR